MDMSISEAPSSQVQSWFKFLLPTHVVKRDGSTVAFDTRRIGSALLRAGRSTGEFDESEVELLEHRVVKVLRHRFSGLTPTVEQVQDIVEQVLLDADYLQSFRACVVYRAQHRRLREERRMLSDVAATLDGYVDDDAWRVRKRTQAPLAPGKLLHEVAGKVIANYWLTHVYPPEIAQAHRDGELQLHHLDRLGGHRAGWSLRRLLDEGYNGVCGEPGLDPPRHLSSALGQIASLLAALHDEWAATHALGGFDTHLAPFVRHDELDYAALCACLREFVGQLNAPARWGRRTPRASLSFDRVCPAALHARRPLIGGVEMPFAYGELQREMALIERAYDEVMSTGERRGDAHAVPFTTAADSDVDTSGEPGGSIGVVTINCARLADLHRGAEPALLARVDRLAELACDSLEIKRKVLQRLIDGGRFPCTRRYLGSLQQHCSTLAVDGLDAMVRSIHADRLSITSDEGQALAQRLLDRLRCRLHIYQQATGTRYRLAPVGAADTP